MNKITAKKDTGVEAITVFVSRKVEEKYESGRRKLKLKDTIPKEIEGIPTDVIELSSPDYKLGRTGIGILPPRLKKLRMGVIRE